MVVAIVWVVMIIVVVPIVWLTSVVCDCCRVVVVIYASEGVGAGTVRQVTAMSSPRVLGCVSGREVLVACVPLLPCALRAAEAIAIHC